MFLKLCQFSYFNKPRKSSKFGVGCASGLRFMTKTEPKNGLILTKLGIYNHHTSNQTRTKFYQNRTIFHHKNFRFSIEKLSDFDKIWCVFGLKY